MRMLGVHSEDLPVLMAIEHWSQAKYVKQHAGLRELESFIADYKVRLIFVHISNQTVGWATG